MNTRADTHTALEAIRRLHHAATMNLDAEAAQAILTLARECSGRLADIAHNLHPEMPQAEIAAHIAANADCWPVSIPAMEESREAMISRMIPAQLGDALPYRARKKTGRGGSRNLNTGAQTDFALVMSNTLREIRADVPQFITPETAPQWEAAALRLAETICAGVWWNYPHAGIIARAQALAKTNDRRCNTPRTVIKTWLKAGFAALARQE